MAPKIHVSEEKYRNIKENLKRAREMARQQMERARRDIDDVTEEARAHLAAKA